MIDILYNIALFLCVVATYVITYWRAGRLPNEQAKLYRPLVALLGIPALVGCFVVLVLELAGVIPLR